MICSKRETDCGYDAYLIEFAGKCVGFTNNNIEWVPFYHASAMTFADSNDAEQMRQLIRHSGVLEIHEDALITSHSWSSISYLQT
jgi:hypothetical protein